jgi:hypothetical protein
MANPAVAVVTAHRSVQASKKIEAQRDGMTQSGMFVTVRRNGKIDNPNLTSVIQLATITVRSRVIVAVTMTVMIDFTITVRSRVTIRVVAPSATTVQSTHISLAMRQQPAPMPIPTSPNDTLNPEPGTMKDGRNSGQWLVVRLKRRSRSKDVAVAGVAVVAVVGAVAGVVVFAAVGVEIEVATFS